MKKLPELSALPYPELRDIASAYVDSFKMRFIIGALKAKLFDALDTPVGASKLVERTGMDDSALRSVLDVLAAMGLVKKQQGRYVNTSVASTYFVSHRETYFGESLVETEHMYGPVYDNIDTILREGFPQGSLSMGSDNEFVWALQARRISRMQGSGPVQEAVELVKKLPQWPTFKRMLDVGGSAGLHTIGFVDAHPSMTGVVFDRPAVVQVAAETIAEYGLSDRIEVLGGSYTHDPMGSGYDFIWASDSLNFAFSELDNPLERIAGALNPGGVFVSNHFHLAEERTAPLNGVLMAAWHWMAGEEMYFSGTQMADKMLEAGFRHVRSTPYTSVLGFGQLDIARK